MRKAEHTDPTKQIIEGALARSGLKKKDIAKRACVTERTVQSHIKQPEKMTMNVFGAIVRATNMPPEDVMTIARHLH